MKRIDEKIKEIEKKDKQSRILYIAFVVLIIAFMAVVFFFQTKLDEQSVKLSETYKTLEATNQNLERTKKELETSNISLQETIETLQKSMTPQGFWDNTVASKSTQAYLAYITYSGNIEILYPNEALENVKSEDTKGQTGWLYAGKMQSGKFNDGKTKVIKRPDVSDVDEDSKPQVNDILMPENSGIYTYSSKNLNNKRGSWRSNTKAIVMDVVDEGIEVRIKIKFAQN